MHSPAETTRQAPKASPGSTLFFHPSQVPKVSPVQFLTFPQKPSSFLGSGPGLGGGGPGLGGVVFSQPFGAGVEGRVMLRRPGMPPRPVGFMPLTSGGRFPQRQARTGPSPLLPETFFLLVLTGMPPRHVMPYFCGSLHSGTPRPEGSAMVAGFWTA